MTTSILICPGPSLCENIRTLNRAKALGFQVFGCNQACLTYPNCEATFLIDTWRAFEMDKRPFPKHQLLVTRQTNVDHYEGKHPLLILPQGRHGNKDHRPFDGQLPIIMHSDNESLNNGVLWALQCLKHLGSERVLLVGSELKTEKDKIYAHGSKDYVRDAKQKVYDKVIHRFKRVVNKYAPEFVINCCPGGALDGILPTMPLTEALVKFDPGERLKLCASHTLN